MIKGLARKAIESLPSKADEGLPSELELSVMGAECKACAVFCGTSIVGVRRHEEQDADAHRDHDREPTYVEKYRHKDDRSGHPVCSSEPNLPTGRWRVGLSALPCLDTVPARPGHISVTERGHVATLPPDCGPVRPGLWQCHVQDVVLPDGWSPDMAESLSTIGFLKDQIPTWDKKSKQRPGPAMEAC
jgi:hypothetical protein